MFTFYSRNSRLPGPLLVTVIDASKIIWPGKAAALSNDETTSICLAECLTVTVSKLHANSYTDFAVKPRHEHPVPIYGLNRNSRRHPTHSRKADQRRQTV